MTDEGIRLPVVVAGTVVLGFVVDLFCLLLLPVRFGGHLVPVGPLLVLLANAGVSTAATRLGSISDRPPHIAPAIHFLNDFHVERASLLDAWELSHDGLHPFENLGPALPPIVDRFHSDWLIFRVPVNQ